jgi:hypothetical protein
MKVYKIRNKDGKYAISGSRHRFNKNGKVWTGIGPLKNHLDMFHKNDWDKPKDERKIYTIPEDWIVEEYELVKINEYNAKELVEKKK